MKQCYGWFGSFGLSFAVTSVACAILSAPAAAAPPQPIFADEASPAPAQSSFSAKSETPEERQSRRLGRMWGWILVGGVGGSAGLVAIGTSVAMLIDNSMRNSDCNAAKVCSSSGLSADSNLAALGGWNAAAWGVAALGFGIGAYFLFANHADRTTDTQVGVAPNGSGATFSLRTAF